jgi:hypothetical protein
MKIIPYKEQWSRTIGGEAPDSADGFFVVVVRKAG